MAGLSIAAKGPIGIVIAPGGKTAYFANYSAATITPIDLSSGAFGTPIKVGAKPISIAFTPDGRTAYVANSGDDTVTPVSLPAA
jgi:DNA-binding beta-propeller fold protein YncE